MPANGVVLLLQCCIQTHEPEGEKCTMMSFKHGVPLVRPEPESDSQLGVGVGDVEKSSVLQQVDICV